jgi:Fe-S-cluster-containing dehydrogenase component
MNKIWSDPADLMSPPARDEFAPEVASAIADLRERGGVESPACPEQADAQREALHFAMPGVNRRGFLQLTGAAAVLAVVSGCAHTHPDTLVPFAQQPEGTTLGEGVWYSTVIRVNGQAQPIMAKTYDGRPIKLDGNPDHPLVRGRSDARTQAALLDLYDPDRGGIDPAQPKVFDDGPKRREGNAFVATTWADLDKAVGERLKSGRILLVTGPVDGPARLAHLEVLRQALGERFRHVAYHPWAQDSVVTAREMVLGERSVPRWLLGKVRVLVAFGSDLLADADTATQAAYGIFRRGADGEPGQVICVEPTLSQLGSCADVRIRAGMDRLAWIAWAVAGEVATASGSSLPPEIASALPAAIAPIAAELRAVRTATGEVPAIRYIAERLLAARQAHGLGLAYAGGAVHSGSESLDLHLAVTWLNRLLGSEGVAVQGCPSSAGRAVLGEALTESWDAVIVAGGANPAFDLPGAAAALAKVPLLVSLNPTRDETTALAQWHAPGLHDLESWGDASSAPGLAELQQPVIHPLWDSRAAEDSLGAFVLAVGLDVPALRTPRSPVSAQTVVSVVSRKQLWSAAERGILPWHAFVQRHWTSAVQAEAKTAAGGEAFWRAALSRGFVEVLRRVIPANRRFTAIPAPTAVAPVPLALVCTGSRTVGDGSQLNNAWLQEIPDPVSKACWDGYAAFSPADAKASGIAANDVVALTVAGDTIQLPALVQDGQHPGTVEVFLGWGRSQAGLVAGLTAVDGFRANPYLLAAGRRWGSAVTVAKTGQRYELAQTQHHNRLAGERIAVDDVLELHRADPGAVRRSHKSHAWENGTDGKAGGRLSIWRSHQTYPGHRWGMAIDLDLCTGCNACMVACSAENNVPVVGRDEVRKNREMHWMRIDRYYSAPAAEADARLDVAVLHQPMLCQQCDNAPCEAVCPANATMKSDEGVNLQVYNRCIGTRYCSNNCPYKVRRFNWYQYSAFRAGPQQSGQPELRLAKNVITEGNHVASAELAHQPLHMLLNPEVTVRHRGVMEKCNFCVQRQRTWRTAEKRQGRRQADGQTTSACAQACPTAAIVWGDLNDQESAVTSQSNDPRAYLALDAESNTRPKVAYLRKLRHRPVTAEEAQTLHGHAVETHP